MAFYNCSMILRDATFSFNLVAVTVCVSLLSLPQANKRDLLCFSVQADFYFYLQTVFNVDPSVYTIFLCSLRIGTLIVHFFFRRNDITYLSRHNYELIWIPVLISLPCSFFII